MSSYSPPKPHVRRERARFEELERVSRGDLGERLSWEKERPDRGSPHQRPTHRRNISSSDTSSSARASPPQQQQQQASPSTQPPAKAAYPNYYDYSENADSLNTPPQQQRQQVVLTPKRNMANIAMQVPIQPHAQQPPHPRLVDLSQQSRDSAPPRPGPGPALTTAQLQQAVARGASHHSINLNGNSTNGNRVASAGTRDRPPSYAGSNGTGGPRSPADDVLPPNKVDLDAARYRHAQQAQSRRERSASERDRPPAKDLRDKRRVSQPNARPASMNMGLPHHNGGRPASPESLPTPPGLNPNIRRLSTPSIPNSVLQPLDAKVVEYGTLMADAQGEMARLDEEMRLLQDRQREAEQRFLEAKAKHDDYRRQYSDVERALRGDFAHANGDGRDRRDRPHDGGGAVPPVPSMPNLQQYGVDSRQGSGMALNGTNGSPGQGHPGMRSQRTVSIQSDVDGDMSRPGSKRGRLSRLFGV